MRFFNRLDYQPLFGKMSPHSSLRGGSKTGPGRRRKSSLLFQLVSYPRCHYIKRFTRNLVWPRGTGKLYDNSQNLLDSEKNTPSFFLINYMQCLILTRYFTTQVTTVLQYSSELQFKVTRKLFSRFNLLRNMARQAIMKPTTTPKRKTTTTERQRNKNML